MQSWYELCEVQHCLQAEISVAVFTSGLDYLISKQNCLSSVKALTEEDCVWSMSVFTKLLENCNPESSHLPPWWLHSGRSLRMISDGAMAEGNKDIMELKHVILD